MRLKTGHAAAILATLLLVCGTFVPAAGAAEPRRIHSGDVIHIEVASRADLSGDVMVAPDGTIAIPRLGSVPANNRTESDLAADLSRRYSLIERDIPRVSVTIVRSSEQRVMVLGAVLVPGAYDYTDSMSVWDAIAVAGGTTDDAQLAKVQIVPAEGANAAPSVVDLGAAIASGSMKSLPKLRPGDTVQVPRLTWRAVTDNSVRIFGAVAVQEARSIEQVPDLATALSLALPAADADLKSVSIVRTTPDGIKHLSVDARKYLNEGVENGNVPLFPGDIVYVKHSQREFILKIAGTVTMILGLVTTIIAINNNYNH